VLHGRKLGVKVLHAIEVWSVGEIMSKKRPGKQRWLGGVAPTEEEIERGRSGFAARVIAQIERLAARTNLFPLFVGPRRADAQTAPRCYLFFSKESYNRGEENLACVDTPGSCARLIIRPFGRGENRLMLLPKKYESKFVVSDLPDWKHIFLRNSPDWSLAAQVLRSMRKSYATEFDVS
jgi:hypothetical protein